MTNPYEAWAAAIDAAQPLYDRAILLGYNVSASTHTEDDRTDVSFWVRRFDLPSGNERTFSTVDEVSQYLDSVAELQRYSLELEAIHASAPNLTLTQTVSQHGLLTPIPESDSVSEPKI